ncbi:glycosyltransferase family 4 protein [Chitinophaga sp. G-6-1-13]|uniref:Glycosyltransferase family 4 protein n=1 Tax=Chitinophaga fulva TaxID=2728842 RepID=A0A848GGK4_9BACT|nr:glycosyltransferase family 4 protein [Chitinophaga fulva]NML37266.1 glycosyltransferase family 4 protein [Chitinophaga fulva]
MKILYCIFALDVPGGMQRVLTTKANYLAENAGYQVHIAICSGEPGAAFYPLSPKITVHQVHEPYRQKLTSLLFSLKPAITVSMYGKEHRFLYKINDGSRKILEFHFTRNYLLHLVRGIKNLRFRKLRLVYVWLIQQQERRFSRHYDRLVLLTNADKKLWRDQSNIAVIPNPLPFTSPEKSNLTVKRVIAIGRLMAVKGFDLLIDAWRLVVLDYPDWELAIFGEGQDEALLAGKIKEYGLTETVALQPPTQDVRREFLQSAICAFPSRSDGFGLVLIEAMECGVPCVAFDCECGPGEIITDEVNGLLVPQQDVAMFAAALMRLMASRTLREDLGAKAIQMASKYRADKIMPHWEELFYTVLHE